MSEDREKKEKEGDFFDWVMEIFSALLEIFH